MLEKYLTINSYLEKINALEEEEDLSVILQL